MKVTDKKTIKALNNIANTVDRLNADYVQSRIGYYGKNEHTVYHFNTKLDKWLKGKTLEFYPIRYAKFGTAKKMSRMTLSVVEFDKDNCIYILLPEDVFRGGKIPKLV